MSNRFLQLNNDNIISLNDIKEVSKVLEETLYGYYFIRIEYVNGSYSIQRFDSESKAKESYELILNNLNNTNISTSKQLYSIRKDFNELNKFIHNLGDSEIVAVLPVTYEKFNDKMYLSEVNIIYK